MLLLHIIITSNIIFKEISAICTAVYLLDISELFFNYV